MRLLEKIILIIYSIIIFILSATLCCFIFNWIDFNTVISILKVIKYNHIISYITLIISIIFMLLSLKCIFFGARKKDYYKDNILLKNEEGKLVITKTSIENLVANVIKGFIGIQEYNIKVKLDKENNIVIDIIMQVKENAIIKELTDNIQKKVKNAIKKTSDLDIKEVNVKIKNIEQVKNIIKE